MSLNKHDVIRQKGREIGIVEGRYVTNLAMMGLLRRCFDRRQAMMGLNKLTKFR